MEVVQNTSHMLLKTHSSHGFYKSPLVVAFKEVVKK